MKVFVDLDGVSADFYRSPMIKGGGRGYGQYPEMYEKGFFEGLPLVPGAKEGISKLVDMFPDEVYILTQPVSISPHSYSEKVLWVQNHLPACLESKICMTQHKELLSGAGRILIDDNAFKWKEKWEAAGGIFFHFDESKPPQEEWLRVCEFVSAIKEAIELVSGSLKDSMNSFIGTPVSEDVLRDLKESLRRKLC